jgi:membrane protein DedA with SNARE-associated domain
MLDFLSQFLNDHLTSLLIVAASAFLDTFLIIGLLLYGTVIMGIAYIVYNNGVLTITEIGFSVFIGAILADQINYFFGKQIKYITPFLERRKRFQDTLRKTNFYLEKYGILCMLFCRFFAVTRSNIAFAFGVAKVRYHHFVICNAFSIGLWVIFWCVVLYFGESFVD